MFWIFLFQEILCNGHSTLHSFLSHQPSKAPHHEEISVQVIQDGKSSRIFCTQTETQKNCKAEYRKFSMKGSILLAWTARNVNGYSFHWDLSIGITVQFKTRDVHWVCFFIYIYIIIFLYKIIFYIYFMCVIKKTCYVDLFLNLAPFIAQSKDPVL